MVRDVRESPLYMQHCATLGLDIERVDEALFNLKTALHIRAEVFPVVPRTTWRCALVRAGLPVNADQLRVYFEIIDDRIVELVYLERVLEDPDEPVKW